MPFDTLSHRPRSGGALPRPLTPGRPFGDVAGPPPAGTGCGGHAPSGASTSHVPLAGRGRATVEVCPPRDFDFSALGDGGTQSIRVAERIDCSQFQAVDLIVRVHTDASIASGCSISVLVASDGYTDDDPTEDFYTGVVGGQGPIVFTGPAAPAAGHLAVQRYTSLGAMLAVFVSGAQATPADEEVMARLSIDLVLREC